MFNIKKADIVILKDNIDEVYENLKQSLLHKCTRFPEFSFDIKKDKLNSKIIVRTLDLNVQAN